MSTTAGGAWEDVEGTMERAPTSPTSPASPKMPKEEVVEKDGITTTTTIGNQTETRVKADGSRVKIIKRVKTTKVVRPTCMADLRKNWTRFGKAVDNEPGLTVPEAPIPFELGAMDLEEKKCRDEVVKTMNLSLDAPIKITGVRKSALATAPVPTNQATQGSSSAAAADAAADGGKKTWAAGRQTKKEEEQSKATAEGKAQPNEVIRISNLTDEISEVEIRRLFGPGNDLGEIRRVFIAKDKQGNRRGFAYVTYGNKSDAKKAVTKMHKQKFKHAVLLVDYGTAR